MTTAEVQKRVNEIKEMKHDPELAHSTEDKLWRDVLKAIAYKQCESADVLADVCLQTTLIEFERWCA